LAPNLQSAVFKYIEQDRNGQTKDKSLVRDLIESIGEVLFFFPPSRTYSWCGCLLSLFVGSLGVDDPKKFYEDEFESHFINLTKEYYSKESSGFIAANSISDYMTKVPQCKHPSYSSILCDCGTEACRSG
jgi:hypothetical protein